MENKVIILTPLPFKKSASPIRRNWVNTWGFRGTDRKDGSCLSFPLSLYPTLFSPTPFFAACPCPPPSLSVPYSFHLFSTPVSLSLTRSRVVVSSVSPRLESQARVVGGAGHGRPGQGRAGYLYGIIRSRGSYVLVVKLDHFHTSLWSSIMKRRKMIGQRRRWDGWSPAGRCLADIGHYQP